MRPMLLVLVLVLLLDIAMIVVMLQFERGSLEWYEELAMALPISFVNACAVWWLALGGRWLKPQATVTTFMTFEFFADVLRKEGISEKGIHLFWSARPREFTVDEEESLRESIRSLQQYDSFKESS